MFKEVRGGGSNALNVDALRSEIRMALINQKVNACPITMRHAWHMSGTFNKVTQHGGSNGATIRFHPESADGANAGLHIIRDLLEPVKRNHPEISYADLYVLASAMAIEFLGGPQVPVLLGRTDEMDGKKCPENGRLPDASQGAQHLRDVFYRMGLNDQEIVALSGGHTLGSAHRVRSGYDGQWTTKPLKFDNEYFVNLISRKWTERKWDGPRQFEDETRTLMMLPTDIALIEDPAFRVHVERYAHDPQAFFNEFAAAYAKLVSLNCPAHTQPDYNAPQKSAVEEANARWRHFAMHGYVPPAREMMGQVDVHNADPASGRTALHFAAFWGHIDMTTFLVRECNLNLDAQDYAGDTPLHDAASHGHEAVVKLLVEAGANATIKNRAGLDAAGVAAQANYPRCAAIIASSRKAPSNL
jgi:hypothetical protein